MSPDRRRQRDRALSAVLLVLILGSLVLAYRARETDDVAGGPTALDPAESDPTVTDPTESDPAALAGEGDGDGDRPAGPSALAQPATAQSSDDQMATSGQVASEQGASDQATSDRVFADNGNLVENGGFERPVVDGAEITQAPGWDERRLEIWADGNGGFSAQEGNQFIELDGPSAGTLTQDITVTPGASYRWSVAHKARNQSGTLQVLIDGRTVADEPSVAGRWQTASGTFVAGEDQTVLSLSIDVGGGLAYFIDNLRVENLDVEVQSDP